MSEQQLFADLYRWLQGAIAEELRQYSPNLAKATGVLKGASLPTSGPAPVGTVGTGYPAAPHTHPFGDITGELDDAQHGDRGGGSLHALATTGAAGFLPTLSGSSSDVLRGDGTWGAGGGGFTSPLTTRGDLLTRDASAHVRLAVGAAGTFLRSDGTDPSWQALVAGDIPSLDASKIATGVLPVAQGGTGVATLTSNGVLLGAGTSAVAATAAGSANQVLRVPGAGGAPAFGALDLAQSAAVTGLLAPANGGTGVNNGTNTLTIPASGTAALRASAATAGRIGFWSDANSLSHDAGLAWDNTNKRLLLPAVPASGGVPGIEFAEGGTSYANFQAWNQGTNSYIFFNVNRYWDGSAWNALNGRQGYAIQLGDTQLSFYGFDAGSNVVRLRMTLTQAGVLNLPTAGSVLQIGGTQILTSRRTGWGAPTGTPTRTTFATSTVTLPQLAERVKALIDDLTTHGVIGA